MSDPSIEAFSDEFAGAAANVVVSSFKVEVSFDNEASSGVISISSDKGLSDNGISAADKSAGNRTTNIVVISYQRVCCYLFDKTMKSDCSHFETLQK